MKSRTLMLRPNVLEIIRRALRRLYARLFYGDPMKYFGIPKWRYLALPFVMLSVIPAAIITLLSVGTIQAIKMWFDAMNWAHYE